MKHIILILLLVAAPLLLFPSEKKVVSGFVRDLKTGEALIGATVYCPQKQVGCTTNPFGFFSLSLPTDAGALQISFIGYQSLIVNSDSLTDSKITLYLIPGIEIDEVTVKSRASEERAIRENINTLKVRIDEVKYLPSLFGENDLVKVIQLMPGVQSGGEGKSELHVRGGSPDQNLVLLDDVQLYYISHFGGIFSIFNPDALHSIEMIKGGFPARYGGRLSSTLDIRMKDGNVNEHQKHVTIGLLSSRITLEGPIGQSKASYMVAGRRSLLPIFRMLSGTINNSFGDLNAKVSIPISESHRLITSIYLGNDHVSIDQSGQKNQLKYNTRWGNKLASLRWNHILSSRLFINTTISGLDYQYSNQFNYQADSSIYNQKIDSKVLTRITDLTSKIDLTWSINPKYTLKSGFSMVHHNYVPNQEDFSQHSDITEPFNKSYIEKTAALENGLYIENDLSMGPIGLNAGARWSMFHTGKKTYTYIEPRLLINARLFKNCYINGTYAEMNQFTHLLSNSSVGMPSDYWMPSTANVPPQFSRQFTSGINAMFFDQKISLTLDAYYKTMEGLIDFKEGAILFGNFASWQNVVEKEGKGYSKGIELLLKKEAGKTTGWVSYTWSKSERQFDAINKGKAYPYRYDRRHNLSLVASHKLPKNIVLSAVWNYGSGYPVTLDKGKFHDVDGRETILWGERNSFRMRDYHRLDVSATIPYKIGRIDGAWTISVLNVYNRKNPYYYYYSDNTSTIGGNNAQTGEDTKTIYGDKGNKLYQQSLFPFFPSVAYSFSF